MTSSTSSSIGPGRRRALAEDAPALPGALDAVDGEVESERASAQRVVLEGLEVADAHGRLREHARLHGPGRAEDDLPRPGQDPVGDLERGVALPDHEHAAVAILLGPAGVDVVRHVLDAGDGREPGRRHAEREDRGTARVLAVRGREDEASVVGAPGRLPGAAVAHGDGHLLREGGDPGLHLLPGRDDVRAVHQRRHERLVLGLVRDQAVVVVPLVRAGARLGRGVWLRPGEQALEDRELAEHAARRVIAGERRALDSQP